MFQPFENASQFYPGLILWCDPDASHADMLTLKQARELRPCLVVAVNYVTQSVQVARLSSKTPSDTRRWVRVDSVPPITWKLSDAWMWVGTPPTLAMVFNNAKVMHPHKDTYYTANPVAASNLQNYWIHRQNYLRWHPAGSSGQGAPSPYQQGSHNMNAMAGPSSQPSPGNTIYSTPGQVNYFNQIGQGGNPSDPGFQPSSFYASAHPQTQFASFNTLSAQHVVVPAGFTETHPGSPGWWRNPETGWFWHASRGLLPPSAPR
ncbi:hypothetical protein C8R44DRAFT_846738 [Mycena epipterygia]|nr:hypothetical protein C8R44DRAFT_846738 [Mycena epipterygia]